MPFTNEYTSSILNNHKNNNDSNFHSHGDLSNCQDWLVIQVFKELHTSNDFDALLFDKQIKAILHFVTLFTLRNRKKNQQQTKNK